MKHYRYIFTLILILTFGTVFAHQDFWVTKDFGNVKVRIKTGYNYEEINKVFIFGELAEKLALELGYKDQIFLDFNHHYTSDCPPDYFISFDKGEIEYTWGGANKPKPILSKRSIVIRQVSRQFDAKTTLKLVEFALKNLIKVKSNQKQIEYNKNYCQWKIQTMDTMKIKEIFKKPLSEEVKIVMSKKIERPEKDFRYGTSYYWQNDRYTVFTRDYNREDIDIKTINNIYDFQKINNNSTIIFDSDSSFYFVSRYGEKKISTRNIIENTFDFYRPYTVRDIGGDKLSIYFYYYSRELGLQPKERTLIYLTDKDKLIQNLDKLIEKE
ncbi:hypothetical protein [Winogradskyella sp. 3972H.M.0a.05]|uniref:hypothetical protein n=1 Tax=Winogradskyella sp. 3972H.M.0a.05 TaxID=2950277 RepID=UPI003396A90F